MDRSIRRTLRLRVVLASALVALFTLLGACADPIAPGSTRAPAGPAAAAEDVRTGYIVGRNGRPLRITYAVRDGYAVLEGDIVLGRTDEVARSPEELGTTRAPGGPRFGVAIDGANYRWRDARAPQYGTVHYTVESDVSAAAVDSAIRMIERKNPGVFFYPRVGEADYLRFVRTAGDACSSWVGRQGGAQQIWVAYGTCGRPGVIAHEILHALGMWHEQTRCDRDQYVVVHWANITPGMEHNFAKQCDGSTDYGEYEEESLMHYGPFAFGSGTMTSLRSKPMGQRDSLATSDVATLRALYAPGGVPACKPSVPGGPCAGGAVTGLALVDRSSGKCLDVVGGDRTPGTPVVTWDCHGAANQRWTLPAAGAAGEVRVLGDRCLDAAGGGGQDGDAIVVWTCHGGANQRWTRTAAGELRGGSGKCVDVTGASAANGAALVLWSCHGGANQQFDTRTLPAAAGPAVASAAARDATSPAAR